MAMILVSCSNEPSLKAKFYEIEVTEADWIPMDSLYHYAKVEMPEITQGVIDHGLLQLYRIIEQNDKVYYAPLPATVTDIHDNGDPYSFLFDYDYTVGEIYIYMTVMDLSSFDNPGDNKFRVVVYQ